MNESYAICSYIHVTHLLGQCFKTFYSRNLRMFVHARVSDPGKSFRPSLMLAGNDGAYPS